MRRFLAVLFAPLAALPIIAHPMGNFSVSHSTHLHVTASGVEITYVLDLAEVPAFELLKQWKLEPSAAQPLLDARAADQVRQWLPGLALQSAGEPITPTLARASIKITPAPGGLFTARIEAALHADARADLQFEDRNYPDRPGWKQIVIDSSPDTSIETASQTSADPADALTHYPGTPPPNDLRARLAWRGTASGVAKKIVPIPQPPPVVIESSAPATPAAPKNDFLSAILSRRDLGISVILIGLAVAFGLGALHAMSPGHGKTIVAAYLVGSRGTMRHAAFLGAMVTFTHTASVFALGLATLFLSRYFVPERLAKILEIISGLSIVAIGAWLFYKRLKALRAPHPHPHHHHDAHDHDHHHDHHHAHDHHHHHVPEGDVSLGSLIALGASGGLVPCPSAMVLLLFAISVGRTGLGLLLLVAFSLGLAGVLMAIGMLVIYAKHWLPDAGRASRHRAFRFIPIVSAAVIICIGLAMTGVSIR